MNPAINLLKWPVIAWLSLLAFCMVAPLARALAQVRTMPAVAMAVLAGAALYVARR